ncbi:phosphate-binding protein PstS [Spirochaetota bacterium]|nr:phosphate-binding protein PstS [Spirochaetota bacterium]
MMKITLIKMTLFSKKLYALNAVLLFLTTILLVPSSLQVKSKNIIGAGASFPYPLYAKMFNRYYKETGTKINYQSIGSGGGIRQLKASVIEFGATDTFLNDDDLAQITAKGQKALHIPIVLGAVSVTFNLKNNSKKLNLDGSTLAEIFMGKITKWNDPKLIALNKNASLPNQPIIVVHRSDGSGTTAVFSGFLAYSSPAWKKQLGTGKSLNWFKGSVGAKGNEGVTAQVKSIPGAIGYISLNYALAAKLPVIAIENADKKFIAPSVATVSAAAKKLPKDSRISLSEQPTRANGYPISTFTWIIVYQDQNYLNRTRDQAQALKNLLTWMLTDGQSETQPLHYAPLSTTAKKVALDIVKQMKFNKKPL